MSFADLTYVPDEGQAAESEPLPKQYGEINNLAGNKELCDRIWQWQNQKYLWFITQVPRREFAKVGGLMDIADRMYRVALNRDTSSDQYQDTLSNVTSTMFHRQVNILHAALMRIFFPDDSELPARYEPDSSTEEYSMEEGIRISKQHMSLAFHTWDKDNRKAKFRDYLQYLLMYGQQFVIDEWERRIEPKIERVPMAWDDRGIPTAYDFKEVNRIIKDCPSLKTIGMEHVWFDEQIDDMEQQRCILWRYEQGWEDLNIQQLSGQLMNVDKLDNNALFQGYNDIEWVKRQRQQNAGEATTVYPEGRYQLWGSYSRIPIVEKKRKSGVKGYWDESAPPQLYWTTFAGQINGSALGLRVIKNPNFHGKIPAFLGHSHKDNKGAFHMALATIIRSLYQQATTNMNQCIDNVTLRNKKPWIADGPIHTRDMTFRANKLIKIAKGTTLKEVEIQDTTRITIPLKEMIEDDCNDTTGAKNALQAQPIGSRATATAERQNLDQALAPLDDMADYIADVFMWLFKTDAELWRQYGDPERIMKISHNNLIEEVKPSELYGPINVKVTAVNRFRNNVMTRMEINSFIQNAYPYFEKIAPTESKRIFWRRVLALFKFMDNPNEVLPATGDYDAQSRAREEVYRLLIAGQWVEPKQEENQEAHLQIEEPALREYDLLPDGDRNDQNAAQMRRHIEIEKQYLAQKSQAAMPQQQQMQPQGGQAQPAQLEGEVGGEQMAGMEGSNAVTV